MIPSPFHGIFSSFSSNDDEQGLSTLKSATAKAHGHSASEVTPPPIAQKKLPKHLPSSSSPPRPAGVGQVALDIFEFENYYILKAPIAGVKLSDLDIEVNDNVITIRGSRKQTDTVPEGMYYLKECFWGDFERSVTLPCSIDPKKVKATFNKENILKVIIPKEERVKIIRISE